MEFVTLNNGLKMPMEGFGVYQVTNLLECEEAVYNAILAGYRLIDTASVYRNEEAVGNAIRRAFRRAPALCGIWTVPCPRPEATATGGTWSTAGRTARC